MKYLHYLRMAYPMFSRKHPVLLTLFVTNRCNLRCRMCLNYRHLDARTDELSLQEYERIAASMNPLLWLVLSGGEPFLRDDLVDIVGIFCRHTRVRNVTIPTNGVDTHRVLDMTKGILDGNPDSLFNLNLSVLGLGERHDTITRVNGSFDKLLDTYGALRNIRDHYSNLRISAIITYSGFNETHVPETVDWALTELDLDSVSVNLTRGDTAESQALEYDIDNYVRSTEKILRFYKERRIGYDRKGLNFFRAYYEAFYKRTIAEFRNKGFISHCHAGRSAGVLYPNGDVFPCELLSDTFGNVRDYEYDFQRVWRLPAAQRIRKRIYSDRCRCFHGCNVGINSLVSPRSLLPMVARTLAAAVWRRASTQTPGK